MSTLDSDTTTISNYTNSLVFPGNIQIERNTENNKPSFTDLLSLYRVC